MGLRINLNTSAASAHRYLSASDTSLSKTIERLSSGFRINSAGDDPAGLVISEKLRAQVSGLGQAIKNAGDAVNMVKTSEGALNEVHRLLSSMRDLAVHAANTGATDQAASQADQAQINNAILSINKIAKETQFGRRNLLDGSAGIRARINGTAVMSGDFAYTSGLNDGDSAKITITQAAAKAVLTSGGTYGTNASTSGIATYSSGSSIFDAAGGTMTITGNSTIAVTVNAASTVDQVALYINTNSVATGVGAALSGGKLVLTKADSVVGNDDTLRVQYNATHSTIFSADATSTGTNGTFASQDGYMYVNGIRVDYSSGDTVDQLVQRINAKTSLTGAVARVNTTTDKIELLSQEYGSEAKINVSSASLFLGNSQTSANAVGVDVEGTVMVGSGTTFGAASDALWNKGKGLILKDTLGNKIVMRESFGSVTGDFGTQFDLGVNSLRFQVGAYENQIRDVNISSVFAEDLGRSAVEDKSIATMDVTSYQGAVDAIKILDDAITDISSLRAALGATQKNVLESSVTSLTIAKENIASSESTIRDTDMAAEVVNLTKSQILQQSGVSMLAQANQSPQTLLKLLQ